jgi:hypothetical protein
MTDDLLRRFAELNPVLDPDRLVALDPPSLPPHPVLRALLERGPFPEHELDADPPKRRGHHTTHHPPGRTPEMSTTQRGPTSPPQEHPPRNRALLGSLAAGVVLLALGIGIVASLDRAPTETVTDPAPATPVELATALVEAYAVGDIERADGYLAPDADLSRFTDGLGDMLTVPGLREAVRFELLLDSCREGTATATATRVSCYFDYHGLGSRELGLDPFSGSRIDVTVGDEAVTAIASGVVYVENGFSRSVWEPFSAWIAEVHPDDVPVMYGDRNMSTYNTSDESIARWEARVGEYLDVRAAEPDDAER